MALIERFSHASSMIHSAVARPVTCALLLLALSSCAPPATLVPSSLSSGSVADFPALRPLNIDSLTAIHDEAEGVFLNRVVTLEHNFGTPFGGVPQWTYVSTQQLQYVVLDPDAEWLTTQTVLVGAGGAMNGMFARVTSPDGSVTTFTEANAVQSAVRGGTSYKMIYPGIVKGSLIEEASRVTYTAGFGATPPLREDIPLTYGVPVDHLELRYLVPATWGVQVKETAPGVTPDFLKTFNYDGSQKTLYRLVQQHIPAYEEEEYAPFPKETEPYVDMQITRVPDVGYNGPASWEDLAREFSKYAFRKGGLFSNPVKDATRLAVPDLSVPDSLKLVQIVSWVQSNIVVGATDKDDLTTVVSERRGNPLLICGLTQAMLDRVGVEAEFLLIHPQRSGYFDRGYISASQLPIPAVGASVGGQEYVVFPFIEDLPVTYVPPAFDGAVALRITPDGFGGWRDLPSLDVDSFTLDGRFDVLLREDGVVEVEESQTFRDIAAWSVRRSFDDLDADEREDRVREMMTYDEGEVGDFSYDLIGLAEGGTPLEVRIRYTIPNLITLAPDEVLVQTAGLLSPVSLSATQVDPTERRHPIRIDTDSQRNRTITIRYPHEWALATDLEDVDESNRFGSVRGRYTLEPGEIRADQRIALHKGEAPRDAYADLLELTGRQSNLFVPTLVFTLGAE